jgi:hypothetical protein
VDVELFFSGGVLYMPRFKQLPLEPSQLMLFGTSVEDALPADCDVRSFSLVMDCLDYSPM